MVSNRFAAPSSTEGKDEGATACVSVYPILSINAVRT